MTHESPKPRAQSGVNRGVKQLVRCARRRGSRYFSCPLAVSLLLGLGSCAARVPVTISADSAANDPAEPEPPDPENAGRLQNCSPGTADCDRNAANDCEAVLADDPQNCGVGGVQCAAPNAEASCLGGTCRIISCSPGHCDSDGELQNGCETAAKSCHPTP